MRFEHSVCCESLELQSSNTIKWFKNINDKGPYKFLQFDRKDFSHLLRGNCYMKLYNLLNKMLITRKDVEVIFQGENNEKTGKNRKRHTTSTTRI